MQETWAWSDGSVFLNAMLRLVHPGRGGRLVEASARLAFADDWQPGDGEGIRLSHESGMHVAALTYGDGTLWAHPAGVEEPTAEDLRTRVWEPVEAPPFYRFWGPYYEQWGGTPGWISLRMEKGPAVRAVWAESELRDRASSECFKGVLALLAADGTADLNRKVSDFENPVIPEVSGGQALYYSAMEGTTAIRQTGERVEMTFPPDPQPRQARLHLRGLGGRRAVRLTGCQEAIPFPLSNGGTADDPNGPNLLRPDDRHGPMLTDASLAPEELLTAVPLAADRKTTLTVTSSPGIWIASQKWDERQNLLLFSSAHPQGNLGALSLRDLKVRDLRVPGDPRPAMARLPLYWFEANANSAHHCLNCPRSLDLIENGPDAVHFRVVARNPAGTAESDIDVRIPFAEDRLRFDLRCRFTALQDWDIPGIQYCNFFPEAQRHPEGWGSDRVLVMAADGQRMRLDHRAGGDARLLSGARFQHYEGNLFVALYGGPRGNILALARPREIPGARPTYVLCECWLDNHLNLSAETDAVPAGTHWAMDLTLEMLHTTNVDEDLEALGRQALESGEL